MCQLPTPLQLQTLEQVLKQAELIEKNKLAAKEQLLRIQLLLAKRVK